MSTQRRCELAIKNKEREKWPTRKDFYLSCAGGFIGLGNVWRFPYLCYENGGAIFFIPYLIALFAAGIPVFFAEVAVGQYTSEGGITAWQTLAPITAGIGYGGIILTCVLNVYYIVVLAWSVYYLIYSCVSTEELHKMWNSCGNSWNDVSTCKTVAMLKNSTNNDFDLTQFNSNNKTFMTPIEQFWENKALKIGNDMSWSDLEPKNVNWPMFSCVVFSWIICYFCVWKGIKWTGKVVMFTATFPVAMLMVLLVRGVTLPGAWDGIVYYVVPRMDKLHLLWGSKIWIDAVTQVLFSYALCKGALTSLGSYNKFRTNCYKDVYVLSCCNSGVSVVSGFAIFSVLGFMANDWNVEGVDVSNVAKSGAGLAFIAFPQAILQMPGEKFQPAWAIAFFFMIFVLGLDSQFVGLEAVSTSVQDLYPSLRQGRYKREILVGVICLISCLLALPMCTPGGIYLFKLYDYYGASGFNLLWLSAMQCIGISMVYGARKFWGNIVEMIGFRPSNYALICWKYVTPISCFGMIILKIVKFEKLVYPRPMAGMDKIYTPAQESIGWFLASLSILPVFVVAGYHMMVNGDTGIIAKSWSEIKDNLRLAMQPRDDYIQYVVYKLGRAPESITESTSSIYSKIDYSEVDKLPIELQPIEIPDKTAP